VRKVIIVMDSIVSKVMMVMQCIVSKVMMVMPSIMSKVTMVMNCIVSKVIIVEHCIVRKVMMIMHSIVYKVMIDIPLYSEKSNVVDKTCIVRVLWIDYSDGFAPVVGMITPVFWHGSHQMEIIEVSVWYWLRFIIQASLEYKIAHQDAHC